MPKKWKLKRDKLAAEKLAKQPKPVVPAPWASVAPAQKGPVGAMSTTNTPGLVPRKAP